MAIYTYIYIYIVRFLMFTCILRVFVIFTLKIHTKVLRQFVFRLLFPFSVFIGHVLWLPDNDSVIIYKSRIRHAKPGFLKIK